MTGKSRNKNDVVFWILDCSILGGKCDSVEFQRALSYRQALATEEIKGTELKKLTCRRGAEIPPGLGEHRIPPAFPLWLLGGFFGGVIA